MGLQKKIFAYAGVSLVALMSLLTWISLQTNSQAANMMYGERLALVQSIALGIDDIIEHPISEVSDNTLSVAGQDTLSDAQKERLHSFR